MPESAVSTRYLTRLDLPPIEMKLGHVGLAAKDPTALAGLLRAFSWLCRVGEVNTPQTGVMIFLSMLDRGTVVTGRRVREGAVRWLIRCGASSITT